MIKLYKIILPLAAILSLASCGDSPQVQGDAGLRSNFSLEVPSPPGDTLGLVFSESTTLAVRYLDASGAPLIGKTVDFAFLDSRSAGASLSSTHSKTDATGIARIDLVAGAERVSFRIEASAPQAPSVVFYIQVSDQGFVNLEITSAHTGPRRAEDYDRIELQVYQSTALRCVDLDVDAMEPSVLPHRSQSSIGQVSEFLNLAADEAYTLVAWATDGESRPLASTCLSLPAQRLRSGRTFSALVTLKDRAYQFEDTLQLETVIDLRPLTALVPDSQAWNTLSCPLGRAQLLLDCLDDAHSSDGSLDCSVEAMSPLHAAMVDRRGVLDAQGCRSGFDAFNAPSLDATLEASFDTNGGWPNENQRFLLSEGYSTLTRELILDSRLWPQSSTSANHRIEGARLGMYRSDLVASQRPLIESRGISIHYSAEPLFEVAAHGFTLRYGALVEQHFEAAVLLPAAAASLESLGSELIDGAVIGGQSGCIALEGFLCSELRRPNGCASLCPAIAPSLDALLSAWRGALGATGIDLEFLFQAAIEDIDDDLKIDALDASSQSDEYPLSVRFTTSLFDGLLPAELSASTPL